MALNADALCDALFERLRSELQDEVKAFERRDLGGEAYKGRRPALELRIEDMPVAASQTTFPPVWVLHFNATVYVDTPRPDEDPDKALRAMVRAIELALEKKDGEKGAWWTTLGGLCDAAYLNGTVDFYPEAEGGWSAVDVPIEVVTSTKRLG